jgi:hypothetical protein
MARHGSVSPPWEEPTLSRFDDEATEKAAAHNRRWCERNGFIPDQPCSASSGRVGDTVHLRNVNGLIARYRVGPNGRVKRLED